MSSQYLVSARKYRPQRFDTVVGQEHITTTLKNAIRSGQLAHAFLFCGPRGVGKTTCARILAKTINCTNLTADTEACGECPSCRAFQENASFNVFELDAASNNSVDDIRELIQSVRYAPPQGRYKIYIIDEVHMLSASAFNAFLKTLEEPPPHAIFILATTEKHKLLPTILSRCQIFDFRRITTQDIVKQLQTIAANEGQTAEEEALHVIAQKSEGCMRDALSLFDRIASFTDGSVSYSLTMEHLATLDADFYFGLTDAMLAQDVPSTLLLLHDVLDRGFEGSVVLEGLAHHFRDMLLCKDPRMVKLLDLSPAHKKRYFEKALQVPPSFLLSGLHLVEQSSFQYNLASNKTLHTELCLIRLCFLMQATGAAPLSDAVLHSGDAPRSAPVTAPARPETSGTASVSEPPAPVIRPATSKAVPAEPESAKPAEQPPARPEPSAKPTGSSSSKVRVSSNLLQQLDGHVASRHATQKAVTPLSRESVEAMFEKFKQETRNAQRDTVYAQLLMMDIECKADDEAHIISRTTMADSFAQNLRNEMVEFFSKESGRTVRVTTELREDADQEAARPKVLSKQEMFDAMAARNPNLTRLRDDLNLQIDY